MGSAWVVDLLRDLRSLKSSAVTVVTRRIRIRATPDAQGEMGLIRDPEMVNDKPWDPQADGAQVRGSSMVRLGTNVYSVRYKLLLSAIR